MRFRLSRRRGIEDLSVPRYGDRFGYHYDPEGFGRFSEQIAHTMGTAKFLVIQTFIVICWISWNVLAPDGWRLDVFPFILLNLAFSTQAAYAAPLILLAETRQAERDRQEAATDRMRSEELKADLDYLARELASLRIRVADSADISRIEAKLDRLLSERDHNPGPAPSRST